jgi:hypothetical protein
MFSSLVFEACSLFPEKENSDYVARVNAHYLTHKELDFQLSDGLSKEDSAIAANAYIQSWATDKLLLDRAKLNLPEEQQLEFKSLAQRYEEQLFKKAYKDALIQRELNEQIDSADVFEYYQMNRANFKLNEELVKLRYIQFSKKMKTKNDIKSQIIRFTTEDIVSLQEKSLEFKTLSLNDSVWVRVSDVLRKLKTNLDVELEKTELLKPKNFIEVETEEDFFYIFINSSLKRKEEAPLSYISPTIEQILVNRKKINISKKIEKEITKDATKNNEFEVY